MSLPSCGRPFISLAGVASCYGLKPWLDAGPLEVEELRSALGSWWSVGRGVTCKQKGTRR